jgi:hypothetical protein
LRVVMIASTMGSVKRLCQHDQTESKVATSSL